MAHHRESACAYAESNPTDFLSESMHILNLPISSHTQCCCKIIREKTYFGTVYKLYLENTWNASLVLLMTAIKKNLSFTLYVDNVEVGHISQSFFRNTFHAYLTNKQIVKVQYERNVLGIKGPRKIHAHLPALSGKSKLIKLINKQPVWDSINRNYALDFGGRVTMTSSTVPANLLSS